MDVFVAFFPDRWLGGAGDSNLFSNIGCNFLCLPADLIQPLPVAATSSCVWAWICTLARSRHRHERGCRGFRPRWLCSQHAAGCQVRSGVENTWVYDVWLFLCFFSVAKTLAFLVNPTCSMVSDTEFENHACLVSLQLHCQRELRHLVGELWSQHPYITCSCSELVGYVSAPDHGL